MALEISPAAPLADLWAGPLRGILHGQAEALEAFPDEAVDLIVTSPPYWDAIDYGVHAASADSWHRPPEYDTPYEDYLEWWSRVCGEFRRVLKPCGVAAVVVSPVRVSGTPYPVPQDLTVRSIQSGMRYLDEIIWNKTTAGSRRAGLYLQYPSPGYFYPNLLTETILLFFKAEGHERWAPPWRDRSLPGLPVDELFTRDIANNVWHIAPVPPNARSHPAPFPAEIPYRLISLYSPPNGVILDPMVGSGTTVQVANHLGRFGFGVDAEERYVEEARRLIQRPFRRRSRQLVPVWEGIAPFQLRLTPSRYPRSASRPRQRRPRN